MFFRIETEYYVYGINDLLFEFMILERISTPQVVN